MAAKIITSEFELNLAEYLELHGIDYKRSGSNLMMSCPYHEDKHPSFGVNIYNGKFHCLAGSCGAHGNLPRLIQRIEGLPSYDSAEAWLRRNYGTDPDLINQPFELVFGGNGEVKKRAINYIPEEMLSQWDYRHPYLESRGIPDLWQRRFRIGYDHYGHCITIPWFDKSGRCVGVKKRSVSGKFFWTYHLNTIGPNKITFFGLNHVVRRQDKKIIIVESETDALYLWANGYSSIALGTSHITDAQMAELRNCSLDEVVIGTDNDDAGREICQELIKKITWVPSLKILDWSLFQGFKDVNDLNKMLRP